MRILKREEGLTLIEVLVVLSIVFIVIAMGSTIFIQISRYNAITQDRSDFQQTVQGIKTLIERQVRFARQAQITNSSSLPASLYLTEADQIVFMSEDSELRLSVGERIQYDLLFENQSEDNVPFLKVTVAGESKYGSLDPMELKLMILDGTLSGTQGSRLYIELD